MGGTFTKQALGDFLMKNEDSPLPCILFIDEIHNLEKGLAEYMYPIVEDFILPEGDNAEILPFIFMGATTEKNMLIKKFAPLVDRCGCDVVLEQTLCLVVLFNCDCVFCFINNLSFDSNIVFVV